MPRLSFPLGLILSALLFLQPAAADDASDRAAAEAAYAKKTAALPEPTAAGGFDFTGVMRVGGKRIGHARMVAAPVQGEDGTMGWEVKEAVVVKVTAVPEVKVGQARLDRQLNLVSGSVRSTKAGEGGIRWEKTEKGIRAFRKMEKDGVAQEEVRNHEVTTHALTTLAATVLFLKSALPQPGKFATRILRFQESFKGEPLAEETMLEVVGEQELDGHPVMVATGRRGDRVLTVLFDPKTQDPIGLRIEGPRMKLEVLAGDQWSLPATKAIGAALRAAYSFGTGDLEVLDDVVHWKSLYKKALDARSEEQKQKEAITIDQFREKVMTQLQKSLPKNPPEMIGGVVASIEDQVKLEEQEDGTVKAVFPAVFKNLEVVVGAEGGIWYLVQLPSAK